MSEQTDTYKTIPVKSEGLFKDRGSKFFAYAHPVNTEQEVKRIIAGYKKEFHNARHHCYAFKIGIGEAQYRYSDDGEPSGTAGKPIYGQILSHQLTNICIVVVRYFGGTLLGTGGLVNAYKLAAKEAIVHNRIIEKTINDIYEINFSYEQINTVMNRLKKLEVSFLHEEYLERCKIEFAVRQSSVQKMMELFEKLMINVKYLKAE